MKEIKKVFNEETHNKYQQVAKDKYQNNDLYKQSNKNWNKKTKQQKEETINQGNLIFDNIKNLMQKGIKDIQVQNHIKEYQQYITTNYYNCTNEIYNNLATMYLEDERFKNNLNKIDNNFAQFLSDSIKYYCKA